MIAVPEVVHVQALRKQLMPPFLSYFGPITDWLSGIMFGPVIEKYDAVNKASSAVKVSLLVYS